MQKRQFKKAKQNKLEQFVFWIVVFLGFERKNNFEIN
jgi:hypothetical protein